MLLPLAGCIDIDLPSPSRITTPRILGVVVEPPELAPGVDLTVSALVLDAEGAPLVPPDATYVWQTCLDAAAVFGAADQPLPGQGMDGPRCVDEATGLIVLEPAPDQPPGFAVLPGEVTQELFDQLEALLPVLEALDPDATAVVRTLIDTVGLPFEVDLFVLDAQGEVLVQGFKRFAITLRDPATTNPPDPRLQVADVWYTGRGVEEPFVCVPEDGGGIVAVPPGAALTLAPDEDDEAWLETYPVVGLDGRLQENQETAFYSWFRTAGGFREDITQRPFREEEWTAPAEPGVYPLVVSVRDGHLGGSACRFEVAVVE